MFRTKHLVAAAKFLIAATKILFAVPNFVAVTKPSFPCKAAYTLNLKQWVSEIQRKFTESPKLSLIQI